MGPHDSLLYFKSMDELLRNIRSPYWWISVVAIGILINVLSAYLKPQLDILLSRLSIRWGERTAQAKDAHRKRLINIQADQHQQYVLLLQAVSWRARSTNNFIAGLASSSILVLDGYRRGSADINLSFDILAPDTFVATVTVWCLVNAFFFHEKAALNEDIVKQALLVGHK